MTKYENKYTQEKYEQKLALVEKLNSLQDAYVFRLTDDPQHEGYESIMLDGAFPVFVNYQEYTNTYHFGLDYHFEVLPYVRYETEKKIREELGTLQQVHTLNGKKIIAWVEYLSKVWEQLLEISKERTAKIAEFTQEMQKRGASMNKPGPYGGFEGFLVKNGMEFKFQVYDEGYISKKIEIYYKVGSTLEDFDKLADNQWTA